MLPFCSLVGPSRCQDGVTNNCTQKCTRDNVTGVHKCSCREGFKNSSGSETVCEGKSTCTASFSKANILHLMFLDIDECVTESHNCSSDNWMCNNTEGSFECVCASGYNLSVAGNCEGILLISPLPPPQSHPPTRPTSCTILL